MKGIEAPRLHVAALDPQMLKLAGRMADGTVLWMTGLETLRTHIVPVIGQAAEEADRPKPRILTGVPDLCIDDVAAGRAFATRKFKVYGQLPSYRAMLEREGLTGPEDFAVIGTEDQVATRLQEFADNGVDTFMAVEFGPTEDDWARTRA